MKSRDVCSGTKVTEYCLKLNHKFFVFWPETAMTVHSGNGESVPTTNGKRKVRHTIVFMPNVLHSNFCHD